MDGNPTTAQGNWMEIQPLGWKSDQQQKTEKFLDFAHASFCAYPSCGKKSFLSFGGWISIHQISQKK